jgi:hypothetical protein
MEEQIETTETNVVETKSDQTLVLKAQAFDLMVERGQIMMRSAEIEKAIAKLVEQINNA